VKKGIILFLMWTVLLFFMYIVGVWKKTEICCRKQRLHSKKQMIYEVLNNQKPRQFERKNNTRQFLYDFILQKSICAALTLGRTSSIVYMRCKNDRSRNNVWNIVIF
jgi:hypothetical protein